jgi:hypothetical protein
MMDAEELELVRTSIRGVLAESADTPLPDRLHALGWAELVAEEPAAAIGALCEEHGRGLSTAGAIDVVVVAELSAALEAGAAVVHPAVTAIDRPPGASAGGGLVVDGLALASTAVRFVVPTSHGFAVVEAGALQRVRHGGFDETLGLAAVTGTAPVDIEHRDTSWADVVVAARRALAHELVGVAEAALAIAVEHVTQRHQFGQPIAGFQSVRHRLADVHVAITAAQFAIDAAWAEPGFLSSVSAKALAGRAALASTRDAQQVCGALGFTWEHGLHRYLRRAWMLDSLYGTADELERQIGAFLKETGKVPRLRVLGSVAGSAA